MFPLVSFIKLLKKLNKIDNKFNLAPMALVVFIGFFVGLVTGQGNFILSGALAAIMLGVAVFFVPSFSLLFCLFVLVFYIQGTVRFFLSTNVLSWLSVVLAFVVGIRWAQELFVKNYVSNENKTTEFGIVFVILYLLVCVFSVVVNQPGLFQLLLALKNVIPMLLVLFVIYYSPWGVAEFKKLWAIIILGVFIQFPFVVYQHFFVASSRLTQGWDSVVGTMGGGAESGGLNAMLVIFCLSGMAYVISRAKRGLVKISLAWLISFVVLAIVLLGEVKAAFLWLPFLLIYFFWSDVVKKPEKLLIYTVIFSIGVTATLFVYQELYWQGQKLENKSFSEKTERMSGYFFDINNIDFRTGEVGRGASIGLWLNDPKANVFTRILGYSPGASKSVSLLGQGDIAKRYEPLKIDATSIAVLLWDTGAAGMIIYLLMFYSILRTGFRLRTSKLLDLESAAMLDASIVTAMLIFSLIPYNQNLSDEPTAQLMMYFVFGVILKLKRTYS